MGNHGTHRQEKDDNDDDHRDEYFDGEDDDVDNDDPRENGKGLNVSPLKT